MYVSEEFINERLAASTVKITRVSKLKSQAGGQAFKIAKANNDPIFLRYQKYRTIMLGLKKRLVRKYAKRGLAKARRAGV